MTTILPTGIQYRIEHGDYTAVVTETGATLRSLTHRGRETLWTFDADEVPRGCAGATLAPWPNRIRDGRYTFDGVEHRLPLSEPALGNAIHGLAMALPWSLVARSADVVTLAAVLYPQTGWPGTVRVQITYALGTDGLTVTVEAMNAGGVPVPFGYGAHPVFAFDDVAAVELALPFSRRLRVDERLLPVELADIDEAVDFREPRAIGDVVFDTAFTGAPGGWEVGAEADGHAITLWADESFGWVQLYTRPGRDGLAIEPMTCAADAFNEGPTSEDVIRLAPGETVSGTWGVRVS